MKRRTLGEVAEEAESIWSDDYNLRYPEFKKTRMQYVAEAVAREVRRRDARKRKGNDDC